MSTSVISNDETDDETTILTIPVNKNDLGGFISDLLGQKQSLERTYDAEFEIDHSWLMNLHEMIDQRISQQANSHLINFTAVVYFKGGFKRTITTIEAFKAYHETKREISNGIKIVWEYLVHFPNRAHPEKQQISFTALLLDRPAYLSRKRSGIFSKIYDELNSFDKKSMINIQIDHTERTWGDDIENIISTSILDATKSSSIGSIVAQFSRIVMAIVLLVGLTFYPLYSAIVEPAESISYLQADFSELKEIKNYTSEVLDKKIDLIFEAVTIIEQNKASKLISFLGASFVTPFLTLLFLVITRPEQQSHILLSPGAVKQKEKVDCKNKNKFIVVLVTYAFTILAGVISNYGFQFLNG
ncbi:hypothetical protein ACKGLS_000659 [Vibrio alginolyticus]